jgi:glycosyltransferase involved in cell wall biosynthesis
MMSERPFVSVIIPAYNAEAFLSEAVESVLRQVYSPLEIIIVDDCSTDGTATIASSFRGSILCVSQSRGGPAAARNMGLSLARGDVISFLDADDLWPINKLTIQLTALAENPQAEVVLGHVQYMRICTSTEGGPRFQEFSRPCISCNLGSALFRKSVFETVGTFDSTMPYSEDVDWFMRARELGTSIYVQEEVTLLYRIHQRNMSRDKRERNFQLVKALKKSLDRRRNQNAESTESLPRLTRRNHFPATRSAAKEISRRLVSVIIAVKNGGRFLEAAIRSVLAQNYEPIEIIVVDGQSEDDTAEVAKSFGAVRYIYQPGDGVAQAYNIGVEASKGEFIGFLSHDDLWAIDKLSTQVGYLTAYPEVQYVAARVKFVLEPGSRVPPGFRKELLEGDHVGRIMETLVARRSLFATLGPFDEQLVTAEDVDWFARAQDYRIPTAVIPKVLLYKRIHDANLSLNTLTNNRNLLYALKRSLDRKRSA